MLCLSSLPACTSLLSALYSVVRSIITIAMLYGFCYGALKVMNHSTFLLSSFWISVVFVWMLDCSVLSILNIPLNIMFVFRTRGILSTFLCFSQCFVGCWLRFHTISAAKAVTPLFSCKSFCECVGLCF